MDVGASRNGREEPLAGGQSESVAHGVDEDVGREKGKSVPGYEDRGKRLAEQSEVRPFAGQDIFAGTEIEEADAGGVEMDVEAVTDVGYDLLLARVVVAGVDYA